MSSSSTVIAQLVYTFGGSNFAGANGSMMIEVVVRTAFSPSSFEILLLAHHISIFSYALRA